MNFQRMKNEQMVALVAADGTVQFQTIAPDAIMCVAMIKILSDKGIGEPLEVLLKNGMQILPIKLSVSPETTDGLTVITYTDDPDAVPITWGQLKSIANTIYPEHLDGKIRWWGVDRGGIIKSVEMLEEPYLLGSEGYYPESVKDVEDGDEIDPADTMAKGTPIIWVD